MTEAIENATFWIGTRCAKRNSKSVALKKNKFACNKISSSTSAILFAAIFSISFPELRSPWPAVGKRELWEHPFSNNNGNNRILHIRFYCAVCMYGIYGACLKWMLPELSFSDRWSRGTKLWERDCDFLASTTCVSFWNFRCPKCMQQSALRLRLYGNNSLCDRLRSAICHPRSSAIIWKPAFTTCNYVDSTPVLSLLYLVCYVRPFRHSFSSFEICVTTSVTTYYCNFIFVIK